MTIFDLLYPKAFLDPNRLNHQYGVYRTS